MRVSGGLTLLVGLGLFAGTAYVLTRREEAIKKPSLPQAPVQAPGPTPSLPANAPVLSAPPPPPPPQAAPSSIIRESDLVRATVPIAIPTLDPGLTIDEIDAVSYALARETDPGLLQRFAATFLPSYPVTGSLLLAKARLLTFPTSAAPALQAKVENAVRQSVLGTSSSMAGGVSGEDGIVTGPNLDDAIEVLLQHPGLVKLTSSVAADQIAMPLSLVKAALSCLTVLEDGGVVVDPAARQRYREGEDPRVTSLYEAAKKSALRQLKGEVS